MSQLLAIRTEFVKRTGRFDLVADFEGGVYTDNGANAFIQAGLKILDSMQETPGSKAEHNFDIAATEYKEQISYLRAVEEVWLYIASEGRKRLVPLTLTEMREKYPDIPTGVDTGEPVNFVHSILRPSPSQNTYANHAALVAAPPATYDYEWLLADSDFSHTGILWMPPADTTYSIKVIGWYWSKMITDTDYCWWSVNHPELIYLAGQMAIEMGYRNHEGVRGFRSDIQLYLDGIDKDLIRGEIAFENVGNQRKG